MSKKQLIKWLESLPDDVLISIRDISQKRDYPTPIDKVVYPLYCSEYDYLSQKEYKLLDKDEKEDYEKLAIIQIDSDNNHN
jgi:hypothetical protein